MGGSGRSGCRPGPNAHRASVQCWAPWPQFSPSWQCELIVLAEPCPYLGQWPHYPVSKREFLWGFVSASLCYPDRSLQKTPLGGGTNTLQRTARDLVSAGRRPRSRQNAQLTLALFPPSEVKYTIQTHFFCEGESQSMLPICSSAFQVTSPHGSGLRGEGHAGNET